MTRRTNGRTSIRAGRLSTVAAGTVCTALLASGCVQFGSSSTGLSPGSLRITADLCATGSSGCNAFPDDVAATTGIRQILVALQVPATVVVSPDITSVPT
ncbi:MAG: hypothetical protein JHC74_07335, partial [Thermoleophilia bacterium]|nr:hypothetical protein [Thermoleophilia bacterium]